MKGKYYFPRLQRVTLNNFSLYKKSGKIFKVDEEITKGVYCLAGANGLGKTTFMNSINYGLTGVVLEPNREVFSPGEIVVNNKAYTKRYFIGRIQKEDESTAEISLQFKVNKKEFHITRRFFNREGLERLKVYSVGEDKKVLLFENDKESPEELNIYYQKLLAAEMEFINFDFFIFYQLYVLSFDENRRMIFWEDRASATALSVAFNSNPQDSETLSEIRRGIDRHESNAKNARWQATQANNKVKELKEKTSGAKTKEVILLEREFNRLYSDLEKSEKTYRNISIEYDSLMKRQTYLNSEILQLKKDHAKLFSKYTKPRSILTENYNVQISLKKEECCLCGTHGNYVIENIQKNIHKDCCPLCDATIVEHDSKEQGTLLISIQHNDNLIAQKTEELNKLIGTIEGKAIELERSEFELQKNKTDIESFTENSPDISFKGTGSKNVDSLIEQYEKQFQLYDQEAILEYKRRDILKIDHDKLLTKLEDSFKEARLEYVPIFRNLAQSFIGLDLSIELERSQQGLKLVLQLENSPRTESFQLSESQRFFLDIALRMSLVIFLCKNEDGGTMMVDTPEGSLDIAYESRVGNMFAEFVTEYHQNLFMTANINASQLLISLAEKCSYSNMTFKRMLDWTDLNLIQKEGESLFQKVYSNIESALKNKK